MVSSISHCLLLTSRHSMGPLFSSREYMAYESLVLFSCMGVGCAKRVARPGFPGNWMAKPRQVRSMVKVRKMFLLKCCVASSRRATHFLKAHSGAGHPFELFGSVELLDVPFVGAEEHLSSRPAKAPSHSTEIMTWLLWKQQENLTFPSPTNPEKPSLLIRQTWRRLAE